MLAIHQTEEEAAAQFERAVANLRDPDAAFTAETIYSLSDLAAARLEAFRSVWGDMSVERRRSLIKRLVESAEMNFELDFSAIIHPALDDADSVVRQAAIEGVLEDCPARIVERLMAIAGSDPFSAVRAGAARALGRHVLRGELGKLPPALTTRLQDGMLNLYRDLNEEPDVRRRALEAAANCTREGIEDLIREAYVADELPMRVSAVFAMGRTCDDVWLPEIMDELSSANPELRYEAARAAGELELKPTLRRLAELAYEDDIEIQEMAIWALGEIGGKAANQVLTNLAALAESTDDPELAAAVSDAQAAALLVGEDALPLFDFSGFEDDDLLSLDALADAEDDDADLDGDDYDDL
jgi:HEAT repeat protein